MEENAHTNKEIVLGKVKIFKGDHKNFEFSGNSADLVFTNWYLMTLSDNDAEAFLREALSWLRPGGHLFIRESSFEKVNEEDLVLDDSLGENRKYRSPLEYSDLFYKIEGPGKKDWNRSRFEIKWCKTLNVYAEVQNDFL